MAFRPRLTLITGLIIAAAALAGCGSQTPIKGALSQSASSSISNDLSAVSNAVNGGSCSHAQTALTRLDATLSGLSSATNSDLVANLKQGSTALRGLALKDCRTGTRTSTSSSTTSTTSTPTTTSTTSTPTTTSTTTTTTTQTQTQTQSNTVPGTGTVTTLSNQSGTNTNGGAGLGSGGGNSQGNSRRGNPHGGSPHGNPHGGSPSGNPHGGG